MNDQMKTIQDKAAVLADALPYLRDFNDKIIVIGYLCSDILSGEEEQEVMRDITLLKTIGMKPIIVHDTRMGADKFRENKRLAKLVEFCGVKAVGICGIDEQTLNMTLENGYIPVVSPHDIDTEYANIHPADTARDIAVLMNAEKLVYLGRYSGIIGTDGERILSMTISECRRILKDTAPQDAAYLHQIENMIDAIEKGVFRSHMLNAKFAHAILLELFSIYGIGSVLMGDERRMYFHERK